MSTTTIRLEDELKTRVSAAARQAGMTTHAFILDAVAQTVARVEEDQAFHALADARWQGIQATGKTVPWDEAQAYLKARANGERARKPTARKLKASTSVE